LFAEFVKELGTSEVEVREFVESIVRIIPVLDLSIGYPSFVSIEMLKLELGLNEIGFRIPLTENLITLSICRGFY